MGLFRYPLVKRLALLSCAVWVSCTHTKPVARLDAPATVPVSPPPPQLFALHPASQEMRDVEAIFLDKQAPQGGSFRKDCDQDYRKLMSATQSKEEILSGVRELVLRDPIYYHFCFYGRFLALNDILKNETYIDEKQKELLKTYEFLIPVARSFLTDFLDSRYIRWATSYYQKLSAQIFFRPLALTPEGTSELVQASNPFQNWKAPASSESQSVLEKYKITPSEGAPPQAGVQVPVRAPLPVPPVSEPSAQSPLPSTPNQDANVDSAPQMPVPPPSN